MSFEKYEEKWLQPQYELANHLVLTAHSRS